MMPIAGGPITAAGSENLERAARTRAAVAGIAQTGMTPHAFASRDRLSNAAPNHDPVPLAPEALPNYLEARPPHR